MEKYDIPVTVCGLCGSQKIYKFHEAESGEQIFKCPECFVQFMNPQLSYEYLDYYYSTYMRDESEKEEKTLKLFDVCLSSLEKIKPEKGNFLDVGCGNGFFIRAAKKRGWRTSGHEINCEAAKKLSEKLDMKIYCGDITSINFNIKFNAVTMFHVLEHLKNPQHHIKYIHSILNEQGIFLLALPNILNRSAIFKLFLEKIKIRRTEIAAYYDIQHHLWYFSPASVRKFLESNGFEVINIKGTDAPANVEQSKMFRYFDEKIFSKLFWHSSMEVIARKIN